MTNGYFDFSGLCPGNWKLTIHSKKALPDHYKLVKDNIYLKLEPGQRENIELRIVPVKREMELLGQGKVLYSK